MKIAICTGPLESGHKQRGTGVYTKRLIEAMGKYQSGHEVVLFTQVSEIPQDVEVVHYPFFDPFFLTLGRTPGHPVVVTVHDLIPIAYRAHFPSGIRGFIKWQIQKATLMKSACIVTDSQHSKDDIVRFTGYPKNKISVVYLAPTMSPKVGKSASIAKAKKAFGVSGKYMLYVGDVNWNKNVPGLIAAYNEFQHASKTHIELVLVGRAFGETQIPEARFIREKIAQSPYKGRIHTLGYLSDKDLTHIYRGAAALLCPSFAEGFGLPVLDGMISSVPVVASGISSIAEIAGPAITINPYDVSDIARGMARACFLTPAERKEMLSRQQSWVRQFTWEKVARQTVDVYKMALANPHP